MILAPTLRRLLWFALPMAVGAPAAAAATIIHVPADQSTIQKAIDAASPGDTVQVSAGAFKENLVVAKSITIASSAGAASTVIDGGGTAPVIEFNGSAADGAVLDGFTLMHGYADVYVPAHGGGGVSISGAAVKVVNSIITANSACEGAGVSIQFASATIQHCMINHNTQAGCSGGTGGGGIQIGGAASAQILDNVISDNTTGSDGGGISLFAAGTPTIANNLILRNSSGQGGGIVMYNQSDANVVQNLIAGNTASQGGGLALLVPSGARGPFLINNTIVGNQAPISGIYTSGFVSTTKLVNNLISAAPGKTALECGTIYSSTPPVLSANLVFSDGGSVYGGSCTAAVNSGGISLDPLLIDGVADARLQTGSPAIDAGDRNAPLLPSTDLDGNPRVVNGTVDVGAYEYAATTEMLSPTSVTFAKQPVGTSSAPLSITATNTGSKGLFVGASASGDLTVVNGCAAPVASSANCALQVTFSPKAAGARTGTLTVRSNAGTPQSIALSGVGTVPVVALSPTSINFGPQPVGTASAATTVTLANSGEAPLHIAGIAVTGSFSRTTDCGATLDASASCHIDVSFVPTAAGAASGALSITDDAAGSPQSVGLSGSGTIPDVKFSSASLTFADQPFGSSSAPKAVTLQNVGGAPLHISSIKIGGDFTETNDCPSTIAAGGSCTLQIVFSPAGQGTRNGSVAVSGDAPGGVQYLSLTGTAVATFSLETDSSSSTVVRGIDTAVFGIKASTAYGFTGAIGLACTTSAPCSFSPASISSGQTSQLTVSGLAGAQNVVAVHVVGTSGAQSAGLDLTIAFADFTVQTSSASATVSAGQAAVYQLQLTAVNGLAQPVALGCKGLPGHASCKFDPPSVMSTASGAAVTLTISTSDAGMAARLRAPTVLPAMTWMLPPRRRIRRAGAQRGLRWLRFGPLLLVCALAALACHGSAPRTAPGYYSVTVTAIAAAGASTLEHDLVLLLWVQ